MKTVRFSEVVEKCGKPEVYLLMSETDVEFDQALQADRILSLSGDSPGSHSEYGKVGYDKKRKGQLLVFPKTLKPYDEMKVIGIKYDLFAGERVKAPGPKKKAKSLSPKKSRSTPSPNTEKVPPAKVIHFPKPAKEDLDDEEGETIAALKGYARQALRALEKNNSVAAYNLLRRMVED